MVATLTKHGDSHALIIPRAMMEQMGIDEQTPLTVTVSAGSLVVTPENVGLGPKRVRDSIEALRGRYDGMMKRLAE